MSPAAATKLKQLINKHASFEPSASEAYAEDRVTTAAAYGAKARAVYQEICALIDQHTDPT